MGFRLTEFPPGCNLRRGQGARDLGLAKPQPPSLCDTRQPTFPLSALVVSPIRGSLTVTLGFSTTLWF